MVKSKIYIAIGLSVAALLPILSLSLFNQPVGDDIWYTWMVKQHGILEAQRQWFITINGRYSANLFMSLNSWVYGSTISFKLLPATVIIAWIAVIFFVIKSVFDQSLTRWHCLLLSLVIVLVYYLNMPGLHEGGYWMSGVTGYQLPILLFVFYPVMLKDYHQQPGWKKYILYPLYLFIAGGFHELIACMAAATGLYCLVLDRILRKKTSRATIIFIIAVTAAFLVQAGSIGNRHKAVITAAREQMELHEVMIKAIAQTGYHIARHCLMSPSFWMGAIAVFYFAGNYGKNIRPIAPPLKKAFLLSGLFFLFLILFPVLLVIYIENNIAPLRVMNISYFVFTAGVYTFIVLYSGRLLNKAVVAKAYVTLSRKKAVLLLPVAVAIALSSNMRQAVTAIASGDANRYHQEVNTRLQLIETCKSDTCLFTCLQHQPPLLCPVDICQDPTLIRHLEKRYRKKLIRQAFAIP